VWLKFKGGKGVATFFGAMLAALPLVGVAACLTWLVVAYVFRFSSLAALTAAAAAPLLAYVLGAGAWGVGFCAILAALIFWRHEANLKRLFKGEEPRIGADKKPA
jgi:acyl phosphate:glycerol-3-phosphate acyltransferase